MSPRLILSGELILTQKSKLSMDFRPSTGLRDPMRPLRGTKEVAKRTAVCVIKDSIYIYIHTCDTATWFVPTLTEGLGMLLLKIAIFMVLGLAHDLHTGSISKEVVEHQLCARSPLIFHTARYAYNPWHSSPTMQTPTTGVHFASY